MSLGCRGNQLTVKAPDLIEHPVSVPIQKLSCLKERCMKFGSVENELEHWQEEVKNFVTFEVIPENKLLSLALSCCILCYFQVRN